MSEGSKQAGDKKTDDQRSEDPSHPGMSPDPAERGKQLGHENAHGGQSVGTGGHGSGSGAGMYFETSREVITKLIHLCFLQVVINQSAGNMCQIRLSFLKNNYIRE